MSKPEYFTVGELAQRVGVTVRTIQYYDQKGLLSPSAKGPQNQRLYTEDNVSNLYRILALKYLGMSLSDIKADADALDTNAELNQLAADQMVEIEETFQGLFKRLTTLRTLLEKTGKQREIPIDWENTAHTIEECQDDSQFFWRLTCIKDDDFEEGQDGSEVMRKEVVSKWHELIADTIRLASEGEPLESPRSQEIARRYLDLDSSQQTLSIDQNFILMENMVPGRHGDGSFDELRKTVTAHLEKVVEVYNESQNS